MSVENFDHLMEALRRETEAQCNEARGTQAHKLAGLAAGSGPTILICPKWAIERWTASPLTTKSPHLVVWRMILNARRRRKNTVDDTRDKEELEEPTVMGGMNLHQMSADCQALSERGLVSW
jgi:hypothetical protein